MEAPSKSLCQRCFILAFSATLLTRSTTKPQHTKLSKNFGASCPRSPVPDIAVVRSAPRLRSSTRRGSGSLRDRLSDEDGPLQGSPDWLIEIRSPDQSTLDLQKKILHCLSKDTRLAWLIDIQRQQIWVWENQELPLVYAGTDTLPTLGNISDFTVEAVIAMTQQR